VGAAETGSGKTLAFGIPIVQGILQDRRQELAGGTGQATAEEGGESADQEEGESADEMEAESPGSLPEEETDDKLVAAEGNKKKGKSNIRTIFWQFKAGFAVLIIVESSFRKSRPQSTQKVATVAFWRTFHHDGKFAQPGEGRGVHAHHL